MAEPSRWYRLARSARSESSAHVEPCAAQTSMQFKFLLTDGMGGVRREDENFFLKISAVVTSTSAMQERLHRTTLDTSIGFSTRMFGLC